jgi:hypothetical protein
MPVLAEIGNKLSVVHAVADPNHPKWLMKDINGGSWLVEADTLMMSGGLTVKLSHQGPGGTLKTLWNGDLPNPDSLSFQVTTKLKMALQKEGLDAPAPALLELFKEKGEIPPHLDPKAPASVKAAPKPTPKTTAKKPKAAAPPTPAPAKGLPAWFDAAKVAPGFRVVPDPAVAGVKITSPEGYITIQPLSNGKYSVSLSAPNSEFLNGGIATKAKLKEYVKAFAEQGGFEPEVAAEPPPKPPPKKANAKTEKKAPPVASKEPAVSFEPKAKLEDWTKFGAQAGSNEGGWFRAPDGSEWYAKRYDDPQKAKAEVVARSLYGAMGFETPESTFLSDRQGRLWQAGKKLVGAKQAKISNPEPHVKDTLLSVALLADRDWNKSDNYYELHGKPAAIDCGAVFTYRAKATSPKPYKADPIPDLDSLLHYDSTGLWSNMAEDDWRRSRARLEVLTDTKIDKAFRGSGLEGLADTVKARRDALIDYAKGKEAAAATEAAALKAAQKKIGKLAPYKPLDFQGSRQAAHQHFRSEYGTRRDTLKRLWSSTAERTPAASAVESYKGTGYDSINHLARKATHAGTKASQVPQAGSNTAGKVDWMDRCFERAERLKQDTNLIRWFSSRLGDTTIHVSDFNNPAKLANLIGMEYRDSGFASSSVYPDWTWRGNVRATIRARKGTAGLWIDPEHAYEGEWLLDRGIRYKIIDAKMVGSDLHIEVEIMEEGVNARKAPR